MNKLFRITFLVFILFLMAFNIQMNFHKEKKSFGGLKSIETISFLSSVYACEPPGPLGKSVTAECSNIKFCGKVIYSYGRCVGGTARCWGEYDCDPPHTGTCFDGAWCCCWDRDWRWRNDYTYCRWDNDCE